jgi:hypothetical protein
MKQYNEAVVSIGKIMSLESKVNVVGSASIKRAVYYSDYDLFENVYGKSDRAVYNHFKNVFEIIRRSDNVVISDFKCGETNGTSLRWTYEEMKNDNNQGVTFAEALRHKSMIKMDIIALISGRFIEITEVYNIYLDGEPNMSPSLDDIVDDITKEYSDEVRDGNYMKALKRMFSLLKLKGEEPRKQDILLDYFNSPEGLVYRCKNDLETMYLVLDSPKFDLSEIRESLQLLKEILSAFPVMNDLEKISKMKKKSDMKPLLRKQIRILKKHINEQAKAFIKRNGI